MYQTSNNSQLLRRVLRINAQLTIVWSLKHHSTQLILIFNRENHQNSESPDGPRRGLDVIAFEIGSNHMQRLEDKRDTFYYTKPNFKKWVDDSTLRLLTEYYSQFLKSNMNIRMTSLLKLTVAHSTRHSFRPKTNYHPFEKFWGVFSVK